MQYGRSYYTVLPPENIQILHRRTYGRKITQWAKRQIWMAFQDGKEICNNFNGNKGCTNCTFAHVCARCRIGCHPQMNCHNNTNQVSMPTSTTTYEKPSTSKWLADYPLFPTTTINVDKLKLELHDHPDKTCVEYLYSGLRNGCDTLVKTNNITTKECKNNLSDRLQENVVTEVIEKELQKGFVYGPFSEPSFKNYSQSDRSCRREIFKKRKDLFWTCLSHITTMI